MRGALPFLRGENCLATFVVACLLALSPVAPCRADVVVVANPTSGIERLSRDDVINIFLGRSRQLVSGISAQPIDLPQSQREKSVFYRLLVNKDLPEINAYWARLKFSGRTVPPREARSVDEAIAFIGSTAGAIGYLDRTKVDGRVRVVLELEP